MIFAQYKNAITFAVVIMGLAVVVADPGAEDGQEAAPAVAVEDNAGLAAPAAAPAPAPAPAAAPVEADPSWYGEEPADDAGAADATPAAGSAGDDGYNLAPARPVPAPRSPSRPAPAPAPQPAEYVPPPPPPQVPPGG